MMKQELEKDFGEKYIDWLKQNISQYKINEHVYRITLPFLDRNNDCVDIYVIDKGNGLYTITDDGYTINDLKWLRKNGIESQIIKCARQDIPVFGICGGYQMLGNVIDDSCNAETGEVVPGIGLLPVTTTFTLSKHRTRARGTICSQSGMWEMLGEKKCAGYEIHMGESTVGEGQAHAFAKIYNTVDGTEYMDGCVCGNVAGTYLHGIFDEKEFCDGFINMLGKRCGIATHGGSDMSFEEYKQREYDKLADAIRENMDMKYIYEIMGL